MRRSAIPWPRVFAEGAIIVVSILLAFAIDAGWESRQEAVWRREALADLRREAESNRAAVLEFISLYEAGIEASERAYADSLSLRGLPADSLARIFATSVFVPTFDPDDAVLSSLVRSGQIDRIENHELRSAISRWLDRAEDLVENRRDSEVTRDELQVILRQRRLGAEFDRLFAPVGAGAADQLGLLEGVRRAAAAGLSPGLQDLLHDPEFHELLAHRVMWSRVMISELDQFRAAVEATLALLDGGDDSG